MSAEIIKQIDDAVSAHSMWKSRLKQAIDTGISDFKCEVVKTDNQCAFGKWLYGAHDSKLAKNEIFKNIKIKHASFHIEAAGVLDLALKGDKSNAKKLMSAGSNFENLSNELTKLMLELKKAIILDCI